MAVWDKYLTVEERAIYEECGWGARGGLGTRPAVVIVDVNNAFVGDKDEPIRESMKKWRSSCGPVAWRALPKIQELIRAARERNVPLIYTTGMPKRADGFDRGSWAYKNPRHKEDRAIIVPGYPGSEIVKQITPESHDIVIYKPKASAFHNTPLIDYLNDLHVDSLIICGTVTSGCVRATVVDASSYNYRVALVEECTFDRFEVSHAINLFDMNAKYADVISLGEAKDYLASVERGLYDDKIAFPLMVS